MSASAGVRGAHLTAGKRGIWSNTGLPGTGLSYRSRLDKSPAHQRRVARENARLGESASTQMSVQLSCDEAGKLEMRDSQGHILDKAIEQIMWSQQRAAIDAFLQHEIQRINDGQELLLQIHEDTPSLDTPAPEFERTPFPVSAPEQPLLPELPSPFQAPKRWFWHVLFAGLEARRKLKEQAERQAWEIETIAISEVRTRMTREYEAALQQWQHEKAQHDAEQHRLAEGFAGDRDHNTEFMSALLEQEIAQLDWPRETLVDFDIEQEALTRVLLDVDLPTAESFPSQEAALSKTGKRLVIKQKSATQKRKDYMQHVHGVVFRLLGVVFVTLPSVQEIKLAAYTQQQNHATGHEEDIYLLNVTVSREAWATINLARCDQICPVSALEQFDLQRDMTKTGVFRPIQL